MLAGGCIRVLDVGRTFGQQFPVLRQRSVHRVDLESLEMRAAPDVVDALGLGILVGQQAEAAYLERLHHDELPRPFVPLNGCRAEHVVDRVRILHFARAVRTPGRAAGQENLDTGRIGDVHDLQVPPDVLVEVAAPIEVDDVLPGMKRLDCDRVVRHDGHVRCVVVRVPVIEHAVEGVRLVRVARHCRVREGTGCRVQAKAAGCRVGRCAVIAERDEALHPGVGDVVGGRVRCVFGSRARCGRRAGREHQQ